MPVFATAAVGAWIGSTLVTGTVLGLSGAAWGWVVGSTLGGMLFGPRPEDGPRITDGKFASGAYGQFIPISYGTIRHKAQVVWFSGLHEHKDEVGGNSISDGATVYTYSCDLLVSACEGPQGAVLRIWANGRLIWTVDGPFAGTADEEIIKASNVRVYLGAEDQLPDPLYEADVGTENAVAYRGQVTVMLEGMQLAFAGNRPPVIEVEVTQALATTSCPDPNPLAADSTIGFDHASIGPHFEYSASRGWAYVIDTQETDGGQIGFSIYDVSGNVPVFVKWVEVGMMTAGGAGRHPNPIRLLYIEDTDELLLFKNTFYLTWDSYPYFRVYSGDGTHIRDSVSFGATSTFLRRAFHNPITGTVSICGANHVQSGRMMYRRSDGELLGTYGDGFITGLIMLPDLLLGFVSIWTDWPANEFSIYQYDMATDTVGPRVTGGLAELAGREMQQESRWAIYDPVRRRVYFGAEEFVCIIDPLNPSAIEQIITPNLPLFEGGDKTDFVWMDDAQLLMGVVQGSPGKTHVYYVDPADWSLVSDCTCAGDDEFYLPAGGEGLYLGAGKYLASPAGERFGIFRGPWTSGVGEPVTLREIVEDVCERAGLPSGNLDATAGTDLVDGYKIATQSTARAAIDNLRPAYFFDMPESGLQLVLKKRGGAAVATIDDGELGAHLFQVTQSDPTPPYELEHVQEIEVPRTVEVVYIDAAQDYDQGVQRASRQVGSSLAPLRIDVPVSLSVDKAQQVAWVNLLMAHASKSAVKLSLPHSFMALDAADPINVPLSGGELQRIRIERVTRARPMLEIEAVLEDAEIYDQTMTGGAPAQGPMQGTPVALADTVLALIDTSPLRDEDDALAVYAAMGREARADAWSGGVAYKSVDGGSNWDPMFSTASSATIGRTIGALADFTGGNVWDDASSVSIVLSSGTLSSATDAGVLAGMNALAIQSGDDWEIVQFVNAELTDTNTWTISRLLRGRKGTERAIGGHAPLDRVVLLTASSLRLMSYALGEVGLERKYLAVTSGQALADGVQQQRTMNGNTIRPLAPAHIAGTRAAGDLTITWIRRARLNAEWRDLYDVPLDEPTESYEIDILDGATVVRTLTASTTTVEYTAAQQTTDIGSPQASVSVAIYQISSRIGRGHAGTATL